MQNKIALFSLLRDALFNASRICKNGYYKYGFKKPDIDHFFATLERHVTEKLLKKPVS